MSTRSVARAAFYAGAVVVAVQAALLATSNNAVLHGTPVGPDSYMHLHRALRLMAGGHWHEILDPRINAPYGFAIHWTALFDMLLAGGAAPLTWFGYDQQTALFIWGSAVSPVLLIAALATLAWGVGPRVQRAMFLWLTVLLVTQPQLWTLFIAGRADHHSLVIGLLIAQLAWAYALFDGRVGPRWAVAAGVLAGLQLSTSVEALLTILLLSGAITAAWLFFGRRLMKDLALYLGACVVTIFAWLIWERGLYLITPVYDRVSVVHLVALGSGCVAIAVLWLLEWRGMRNERKPQALAIACAVAVTASIFPAFFLGPWPHLDPVIVTWHRQIAELQPLAPTSPDRLAGFFAQMTAPVLALPMVIGRLLRGPDKDRPVMLLSLMGFVLFGGLAMVQMRWAGETQAVMLVPWTLTTVAIMKSTIAIGMGSIRVPLRGLVLSGALLLQLLATGLDQSNFSFETGIAHAAAPCRWNEAATVLPRSASANSIVMAPLWYGPAILWRSDLRVIAGPYEMLPALADTARFFDGSEEAARAVVRRRRISYVLICASDLGHGFGGTLAEGAAPRWMKPVRLDGGPAEFRLYRVAD